MAAAAPTEPTSTSMVESDLAAPQTKRPKAAERVFVVANNQAFSAALRCHKCSNLTNDMLVHECAKSVMTCRSCFERTTSHADSDSPQSDQSHYQYCPHCSLILKAENFRPVAGGLKAVTDLVVVHCPNYGDGCLARIPIVDIDEHLRVCPHHLCNCKWMPEHVYPRLFIAQHERECGHAMIKCSDCTKLVRQMDMSRHKAVSCQWSSHVCICGLQVSKTDQADHNVDTCHARLVDCPVPGCGEKVSISALPWHKKVCAAHHADNLIAAIKATTTEMSRLAQKHSRCGSLEIVNFAALRGSSSIETVDMGLRGMTVAIQVYTNGSETNEGGISVGYRIVNLGARQLPTIKMSFWSGGNYIKTDKVSTTETNTVDLVLRDNVALCVIEDMFTLIVDATFTPAGPISP